jgi:hypothetical protein
MQDISHPCYITYTGDKFSHAVKGKARGGGGGVYLTTPEPTNPLEHNNRAVELGMKGLWDASIREHQIALEGDPFNKMFGAQLVWRRA